MIINSAAKRIWSIGLVVQVIVGLSFGLFEAIGGVYFFSCLSTVTSTANAIFLSTALLGLRHGLIALMEVPAGALADTIGRAHVVTLSFAIRIGFFVAMAALSLKGSLMFVVMWGVLASIFWSISYTFFTGSFTAWCVDRLREDAPGFSYGWLVTRLQSYFLAAAATGTGFGIYLYVSNLAPLAFVILAILSFASMIFCKRTMKEAISLQFVSKSNRSVRAVLTQMKVVITRAFVSCQRKPVLLWLVATFGSYVALMNLVMFLWPVYFSSFISSRQFGPEWIAIALTMVSLRALSSLILVRINSKWEQKHGSQKTHRNGFRNVLSIVSVIAAAGIVVLSVSAFLQWHTMVFMVAAVALVCAGYGFVTSSFETLVNVYIPTSNSQERATIISAGSMLRSILAMVIAIPAGGVSIENSPIYWSVPAALLLVCAVGAILAMTRTNSSERVTHELSLGSQVSS